MINECLSRSDDDLRQVGPSELLPPTEASAPPDGTLTGRQKARLLGLVVLKRVRFIAILLAVGMFIGYWDTLKNYWDKWTRPASAVARQLEPGQEFFCPMDPQVVRPDYEPNGDKPMCPICGMPLSERKKGEKAALPEGITARVQFSPERIQLAGIKTVPVDYRPMVKQTKTVGYVTFDERRLSRIVSRVEGYVEKLYVDNFTMVRKGDPLARIDSPEVYSAAQELIQARKPTGTAELRLSALQKLMMLGVIPAEIDAMLAAGQGVPRLVIRSPQTGYVVDKKIVVGSGVEPRETLFEVADVSRVWVEADVYEKDIALLKPGQSVEAAVEAFPNRIFTGKLALVYPQLDTATRTNRVRFELDNPQQELRPGMFATVQINTPLESIEPYKSFAKTRSLALRESAKVRAVSQEKSETALDLERGGPHPNPLPEGEGTKYEFLAVPERAVVDSGAKKVVYVEREPGLFEGMEVELGPRNGGYYPVLKGLNPGDKVAAAGGFLIDAETLLNPAAASTYFGASGGPQSGGPATMPAASIPRVESRTPADQGASGMKPRPTDAAVDATTGRGSTAEDGKHDAAGVLIGSEARVNSAAASTSIGVSGGLQPAAPSTMAAVPNQQHSDQALASPPKPDHNHAEPAPKTAVAAPLADDRKNIEQLPEGDRQLALAQRACPITGAALGSMGVPVKIMLRGQPVFLCCKGCIAKAKKDPDGTLKKVAQMRNAK